MIPAYSKHGWPVYVSLKSGITRASIVRENCLTMWVMLRDGNVIKRHKRKHQIREV